MEWIPSVSPVRLEIGFSRSFGRAPGGDLTSRTLLERNAHRDLPLPEGGPSSLR